MRFNRFRFIGVFVLILILISPFILGVSISPALREINFEPNLKTEFGFYICGANKIRSYIDGELTEYATIIDNDQDGGCRNILIKMEFPEKIEKPGRHKLLVGALQLLDSSRGGVAGRGAIQAPVLIHVPYPGSYVEIRFVAPNVNVGEDVPFSIFVNNLGTDNINSVRGVIEIFDDNGKIKTLNTNELSLETKKGGELYVDMSTSGMKAGAYRALATVYYDGKVISKEKKFNIGSLHVAINNHTTILEQGTINKFDIDVESRWNNELNDVYAEITIDEETVKTPNFKLTPWQKKKVTAYYDTSGMLLGDYDVEINLFYEDELTNAKGTVRVVEALVLPEEPKQEEPISINFDITPTTILIAIIVLLILVDIVWLVMRRKGKK